MKSNTDAKPPRSAGTRAETRRGRWPLGRAMSGAWGALGGRRSTPPEPTGPNPDALAQLTRARDVLQRDRALAAHGASVRTSRERLPSPMLFEIAGWIAAEIADVLPASQPVALDPISSVHTRIPPSDRRAPEDDGLTFDMAALAGLADELEPGLNVPSGGRDQVEADAADQVEADAEDQVEADAEDQVEADAADEVAASALDDGHDSEPSAIDEVEANTATVAVPGHELEATDATGEPIRTRTMARLLLSQGYTERALVIYDHLLTQTPDDDTLRLEAERARDKTA